MNTAPSGNPPRRGLNILLLLTVGLLGLWTPLSAQDLGPHIRKIQDGIYVYVAVPNDSNCGIILTKEGVVLVDTGQNPPDSRAILAAVKKLTPLPIRYVINTETHGDHTTGNFVFSPPAMIINAEGAKAAMQKEFVPDRMEKMMKESPAIREAAQGYRMTPPQIEYQDKLTLRVGERTIEVLRLKNVHSGADSAVWLPQERVLFAASAVNEHRMNNLRPTVTLPDIIAAIRKMETLNPEIVIPGHGAPTTTKMFDDAEEFFGVLLDRVGKMVEEGKSLEQVKQQLRMPEFASWGGQNRLPLFADAAYRAVKSGYTLQRD